MHNFFSRAMEQSVVATDVVPMSRADATESVVPSVATSQQQQGNPNPFVQLHCSRSSPAVSEQESEDSMYLSLNPPATLQPSPSMYPAPFTFARSSNASIATSLDTFSPVQRASPTSCSPMSHAPLEAMKLPLLEEMPGTSPMSNWQVQQWLLHTNILCA